MLEIIEEMYFDFIENLGSGCCLLLGILEFEFHLQMQLELVQNENK